MGHSEFIDFWTHIQFQPKNNKRKFTKINKNRTDGRTVCGRIGNEVTLFCLRWQPLTVSAFTAIVLRGRCVPRLTSFAICFTNVETTFDWRLRLKRFLFFFLQAISQYCRYYHQSKPFSHITIDLFKETVEKIYSKKLYTNDEYVPPPPISKDEHRSDTDSGHSSIHGDREFVDKPNEQIISRQPSKLKVARGTAENQQLDQYVEHKNVNVIGHSEPSDAEMEKKPAGAALQVIRRKDAILRRRNMQRRNTIDVNCSDMLKATANGHFEYGFGAAKSTNCLDKVGAKDSYEFGAVLNGTSMPGTIFINIDSDVIEFNRIFLLRADLSKANKFHTLPNLRVRRGSRIVIGSSDDGSLKNISVQSKGPEFILNSSLPCQEIDITDAKVKLRQVSWLVSVTY